jgi:hypothetical protein
MRMPSKPPRVVVDGDACPVKAEIARAVQENGAEALIVASYDHRIEAADRVETVAVDAGGQSTDLYIANALAPGDVLVTGDYGLAALGLARGAAVLTFRGFLVRESDIDGLLAQRHLSARGRRGGARIRGPKAFGSEDRARFQQKLTQLLRGMQENGKP